MLAARMLCGILLHPLRSWWFRLRRLDYLELRQNAWANAYARVQHAMQNAETLATNPPMKTSEHWQRRFEELEQTIWR